MGMGLTIGQFSTIVGIPAYSLRRLQAKGDLVPIYSKKLIKEGVCRNKGIKGFYIPCMGKDDFGNFLRGLFDGDGSALVRDSRKIIRFYGHPKPMSQIQHTLKEEFGYELSWFEDKRSLSGMLEVSLKSAVNGLVDLMYSKEGIFLKRKRDKLKY